VSFHSFLKFVGHVPLLVGQIANHGGWRFGLSVTALVPSTKLPYIKPRYYWDGDRLWVYHLGM